MSAAEARRPLLYRVTALGIDAPVVAHPAHSPVAEGKALRAHRNGTSTRNLLLRDKKT